MRYNIIGTQQTNDAGMCQTQWLVDIPYGIGYIIP